MFTLKPIVFVLHLCLITYLTVNRSCLQSKHLCLHGVLKCVLCLSFIGKLNLFSLFLRNYLSRKLKRLYQQIYSHYNLDQM